MLTILTASEACERLRVSDKTLRKLLVSGDLRARKVGREWRITQEAIEEYLDGQGAQASA